MSDMHIIGTNLDSLHFEVNVWLTLVDVRSV